jgi:hypothetical protein
MKKIPSLIIALSLAASAMANIYVPKATLVGESVHVRLSNDVGRVTAVFQFEDWYTRDGNVAYFPVFGDVNATPVQILASSGLEFELDGKRLSIAEPCEAPARFRQLARDPRIHWFSADLDSVFSDDADCGTPLVIKMTYSQPLIGGRFYYLPVIARGESPKKDGRDWCFQMIALSGVRPVRVLSKPTDFERMGDGVAIFLKDGEVVELQ